MSENVKVLITVSAGKAISRRERNSTKQIFKRLGRLTYGHIAVDKRQVLVLFHSQFLKKEVESCEIVFEFHGISRNKRR